MPISIVMVIAMDELLSNYSYLGVALVVMVLAVCTAKFGGFLRR